MAPLEKHTAISDINVPDIGDIVGRPMLAQWMGESHPLIANTVRHV
jgi:hypothetical protein